MTLRRKTLLLLGVTLAGLIAVMYVLSRIVLGNSFARLEEQNTTINVERALNAYNEELSDLEAITRDWAAWDDTYTFIQDINENYIKSNLSVDTTFTNNRVNLMLFIRPSGQVVFGRAFNLIAEQEIPVPAGLQEHLAPDGLLLRHPDDEGAITGVLMLPEGPMLISSQPILTSEGKGPVRGTLVWGRYLNSVEIEGLAESTRLSLALHRFNDPQMPPDFRAARSSWLESEAIFIQPLSLESVAGYALIKDLYGEPSLVLRVDMPRDIYHQGQTTMFYFILGVIVVGLAFGGVTLLLLEESVLSRLARLSANVSDISARGELSARVSTKGRDELSSLADKINRMLGALEAAEKERRQAEVDRAQQAIAFARAEELERSRRRIIAAQEGVRREIASHLHGRVQGKLLALRGRLQELLRGTSPSPEASQLVQEVVDGLGQVAQQEVSSLGHQLYPSILRLGVIPALQSLGDQFEAALTVEVELEGELVRRERANRSLVPEEVRLAAYRIAEEALTNVVKHAQATKVTVRLEMPSERKLLLTVRDNGQGFQVGSVGGGLGLVAMQDYAEAIGGRYVVRSAPGQGTEVTATLPLAGPGTERPERALS